MQAGKHPRLNPAEAVHQHLSHAIVLGDDAERHVKARGFIVEPEALDSPGCCEGRVAVPEFLQEDEPGVADEGRAEL